VVRVRRLKFTALLPVLWVLFSLSTANAEAINITAIKMAHDIDGKYLPVNITKSFPSGTAKVFCWFSWKSAKANSQVTVRWRYLTEDIPILSYNFSIPRKQGSGGVALSMPEGKTLPAGSYLVELFLADKKISSLQFAVLEKTS